MLNELMYHPASTNRLEEWFELHNAGSTATDLSGWRVTRGVDFIFPTNTWLASGAYLVVAADVATFTAHYPGVTNVVGGGRGALSHDGEEVRIEDGRGNLVNSVAFAPEGDWAVRQIGPSDRLNRQGWEWFAEHNGLGKSLELINPGLPNVCGQNWGSSSVTGGTPGRANSIAQPNVAPLILGWCRRWAKATGKSSARRLRSGTMTFPCKTSAAPFRRTRFGRRPARRRRPP